MTLRAPSQLVHLEPEAELIPKKPFFGLLPIRFQHIFWEEKYVLEIWRGTSYARIKGKDSSAVIDCGIEAWKRFGRMKDEDAPR
jgi:hypothetical protein